jgi:hypothetical protein
MAAVSHLFSSYEEQVSFSNKLTCELAENLLKQLYTMDECLRYHGEVENVHFEQLDGIAQNISYAMIPGHERAIEGRVKFNESWEKDGVTDRVYNLMFDLCEEILLNYLSPRLL